MGARGPALVLLDRDGVLNQLVAREPGGPGEAPLQADQVDLVKGAAPALLRLRSAGYLLAMVTNQPAAAKGESTMAGVEAVQDRLLDLLAEEGVALDTALMCVHHPQGTTGGPLTCTCRCRKPAPGLLLDAIAALGADPEASWMVGDSDSDIAAGRAAGVRTVLVRSPGGDHKRSGRPAPHLEAADLAEAARLILAAGYDEMPTKRPARVEPPPEP